MTRRTLCLALTLGSLLAACESTPEPSAPPDAAMSDAASPDVADATTADAPTEASLDVTPAEVGVDRPIDRATDLGAPDAAPDRGDVGAFALTSAAFSHQGTLPAEFTCDGVGRSPPLAWSGAPAGTVEYALLMTVLARDGLKWNWVLHSIPAAASSLAVGSTTVGVAGLTSDGPALAYSPPCSRGPGPMMYTFTLYALSARPTLPARPNQVTGAVLTEAIRSITLASTALTVTYTR